MLVKRGDCKIIDVIREGDERLDDDKARKALQAAKNLTEDGNKTDSSVEAEKK